MIKVLYDQKDKRYNYLNVKGHSEFEDSGKDLVCAAVSSIVFGFMNALDELNEDNYLKETVNEVEIIINNDNEKIQDYFELTMYQLKTIEESYSQYIKIERK